jgi:formamidopyrimidine-DNA glycosylase
VLHLARAGWVRWRDEVPALPPKPSTKSPLAVRVVLDDDSGLDVTEAGTRKSLALYVVRDPVDVPGIASLGPDPLADAFTVETLAGILADAGRSQIKGVLRHQGTIAGIGNAYSDEVLHAARMSPFKPAASLDDGDVQTLYDAIRGVIGDAVDRSRGLAASELKGEKKSHLAVHGRTGEACPVCGDTVREVSFADSSLQYCPTCQTGGKPLADRRMSRLLK